MSGDQEVSDDGLQQAREVFAERARPGLAAVLKQELSASPGPTFDHLVDVAAKAAGEAWLRASKEMITEQVRLHFAAKRLVGAAKAWTRSHQDLASYDTRQRTVNELAEAIDDFNPLLGLTEDVHEEIVEPDSHTECEQAFVAACSEIDRLREDRDHYKELCEAETLDRIAERLAHDLKGFPIDQGELTARLKAEAARIREDLP